MFCFKTPGVSCFANVTQLAGSDIEYLFTVTGGSGSTNAVPTPVTHAYYEFAQEPVGK